MTARKVTISMDSELLDHVDELANDAGQSRSEWLAGAAERTIRLGKLRAELEAALGRTGGPLTDDERMHARAELGLAMNDNRPVRAR